MIFVKDILFDGVVLLTKVIIYQAKVTSEGKTETNVGLAATKCKAKFRNQSTGWVHYVVFLGKTQ